MILTIRISIFNGHAKTPGSWIVPVIVAIVHHDWDALKCGRLWLCSCLAVLLDLTSDNSLQIIRSFMLFFGNLDSILFFLSGAFHNLHNVDS